jgi:prepilin-type N-terminal cleavage/methylation domain-containing protein
MRKLLKAIGKIHSGRMGEGGFTLIELLVVIGILAALAGVVTLAVGQFVGKGACQACITDKHNVQTAVVAYMADHSGNVPGAGVATLVTAGYLLSNSRYAWTWDGSTGLIDNTCTALSVPNCVSN